MAALSSWVVHNETGLDWQDLTNGPDHRPAARSGFVQVAGGQAEGAFDVGRAVVPAQTGAAQEPDHFGHHGFQSVVRGFRGDAEAAGQGLPGLAAGAGVEDLDLAAGQFGQPPSSAQQLS